MNKRIYIEKKEAFKGKEKSILDELNHHLQLKTLQHVKLVQIYDVFHLEEELFEQAIAHIFSEKVTDKTLTEDEVSTLLSTHQYFAIESLPGQFDQRAASAEEALLLLGSKEKVVVRTATAYFLNADIDNKEFETIENYLLNPVDSRMKDITQPLVQEQFSQSEKTVPVLTDFSTYSREAFAEYKIEKGLAMEVDDLIFIQDYFKSMNRNPTETELRVLDTYWSDHCRHTTFETQLESIDFSKSAFQEQLQEAFDLYLGMKKDLNREDKPTTLMDLATVFGRFEKANGRLDDMEVTDEINACSVEIEVDVDGVKEPWLLMFKNETHNHPTEIEPFGGASTCIGGAIRDPLSGRSYVYQAMRITGAGNILQPINETLPGKLPQQVISKGAAHGYSSYGNQIGLATTYVKEYFHDGFVAKRMEVGAVVGAAPKSNVKREKPVAGDAILILGGKTGRDGIGGATGSSKVQTKTSVETAGSEVQKGNAIEERKIQRLFRNPKVTTLIKKSNDFGAGGVCVAIGELADGVDINLDLVPLKYEGLNGTEIAISESQERMAVVVDAKDVAAFIEESAKENIVALQVATVTEAPVLKMTFNGNTIVEIERSFLDTNGKRVHVDAVVVDSEKEKPFQEKVEASTFTHQMITQLSKLNHASQKGLQTMFDSSIGRSTVNQPMGGKYQVTPVECSVQKLPTGSAFTNTVSLLAHGYSPEIAEWSPYHGAAYAMIEATGRLVASHSNWKKARFSYQEYFERMDKKAERFGKPLSALLGALKAQKELGLPSIGGKDSMSGTYEDITVPPSLIAFGVTTSQANIILSPEFKQANENIYYIPGVGVNSVIDFDTIHSNFETVSALLDTHAISAMISTKSGGFSEALSLMTFGNKIGATVEVQEIENIQQAEYAGFIFTTEEEITHPSVQKIGTTTEDFSVSINGLSVDGEELLQAFEGAFEPIYPTLFEQSNELIDVPTVKKEFQQVSAPIETPHVYIPVFPGTNCEYDTAKAFEVAGATTSIVPFRNIDALSIQSSIDEMVEELKKADIFMLSGGFSAADEPDGSAKFITNILLNEQVKNAVDALIARGGLILGICNGFQALVKSGLLPYGRFDALTENSPTLFYNDANQHVAKMVTTKITNTNSPWLNGVQAGDVHWIPVSHGEGKFVVEKEQLDQLIANGQIATQYCDFEGNVSMDSFFNPNGSVVAIEGITSENGQIFGKMGHSERYENGLFKNIPGEKDQALFTSAVRFLQGKA